MPQLKVKIENLAGEPLRYLTQFRNLEVQEKLNDSSTARLTMSMYDQAILDVKPLDRVLSITYGPFLIFRGRMVKPSFNFKDGSAEVNAHDPTLLLKHHYHAFGDYPVEYGYPIDGIGLRALVESAMPHEREMEAGMFPSGILYGTDTSVRQGPKSDPDAVWRRVERGTNVWESVTNLAMIAGAPDFWFRPVDNEHQGVTGEITPGWFCELFTYDQRGEDNTHLVIFECNCGKRNADNIVWEPDGSAVRNLWVQVYPGGDRSSIDDARRARVLHGGSMNQYGMMVGWESSGQKDPIKTLIQKAKAYVKAYAFPPDYFTVTPGMDRDGVPLYRYNYNIGDFITARAKRGYVEKSIEGRVIGARLTQVDAASNTRTSLDCVPVYGNYDDLTVLEVSGP